MREHNFRLFFNKLSFVVVLLLQHLSYLEGWLLASPCYPRGVLSIPRAIFSLPGHLFTFPVLQYLTSKIPHSNWVTLPVKVMD